jgi:peptidoglycan/xylan/chitin deacetylase (PgdA/CDA1 family)
MRLGMAVVDGFRRWRLRASRNPPVVILLYHRVAEPEVDPLLLSVSPQRFADHLDTLRRRAVPTRLEDLPTRPRKAGSAVVVTFDDGYADNLDAAAPLMRAAGIPATVFVTTDSLGTPTGFWWDELAAALLLPGDLPETLVVDVAGRPLTLSLGRYSSSEYRRLSRWSMVDKDPGPRQASFRKLFRAMRPLRDRERGAVLDQLREAGACLARLDAPTLNRPGVARLAAGGVEIGAHTATHPVLAALAEDEQFNEIISSKRELEQLIGSSVSSFSYPFGGPEHYTRVTVAAVRKAGFARACVNSSGGVWPGTDSFRLPRLLVRNWDPSEFEQRLEGWLRDPFS